MIPQVLTLLFIYFSKSFTFGQFTEAMKGREDEPFNNNSFLERYTNNQNNQNNNEPLANDPDPFNISNISNIDNAQRALSQEEQEWHQIIAIDVSNQVNNLSVNNPDHQVNQLVATALQEQQQVINANNNALANDFSEIVEVVENNVDLLSDFLDVTSESSSDSVEHSFAFLGFLSATLILGAAVAFYFIWKVESQEYLDLLPMRSRTQRLVNRVSGAQPQGLINENTAYRPFWTQWFNNYWNRSWISYITTGWLMGIGTSTFMRTFLKFFNNRWK